MILSSIPARQPPRQPWSHERLVRERALALSNSIDFSTQKCYGSACNSYLTFVRLHGFPVEPTPETLSFFVVFMSHHISPRSVNTYLSGLVNQLHPFFPDVRDARRSPLVTRTLTGCLKLKAKPIERKQALSLANVSQLLSQFGDTFIHDDLLFVAILLTAFFALHRLGELTFPDDASLRDWRKVIRRSSVTLHSDRYGFVLPAHKADRVFEGSHIVVWGEQFGFPTLRHFSAYLRSRDGKFPLASPLWLTSTGSIPTRSFFISRMRSFFPPQLAGQSLRAGGATMLAEKGVAPSLIQAAGRWSSDAFRIYVRKNPFLLQALLFANPSSSF
jgi:hypothetical protein